MKTIIEQIYNGKLKKFSQLKIKNKQHKKEIESITEYGNFLIENLHGEVFEKFIMYSSAYASLCKLENYEYFSEGFSLGNQLAIETIHIKTQQQKSQIEN